MCICNTVMNESPTVTWRDFFHVVIVHLQRMWRKQLQTGITSHFLCCRWTLACKFNWKRTLISHSTCHNFPCYFRPSQGIDIVLVGLVLFWILFWGLKDLFFSFAFFLHICSCINSIYKGILKSILHSCLTQQGYGIKMTPLFLIHLALFPAPLLVTLFF